MPAAAFVEIVIEVRAGRHQAVDEPVLDQIGHDQAQAAGAQRAGHPHEDRDIVSEHLLPHAVSDAEGAPLK